MMNFLITNYGLLITFVLGTAIGSFLNVWSRRLLRGKPPTGRSRCEHCGHVLGFFDLIPLLSFAVLRGRCRYCHKPLSWQYPLVEGASGLLFAALAATQLTSILGLVFLLVSVSTLIVIFITDFSAQVIFDQTLWIAGGAAFFYRLFLGGFQPAEIVPDLITAFLVFLFLLSIRLITKKKGLGDGDPLLGFAAALLVGFPNALVELFLAFVLGGAIGAVFVLSGKRQLKDRIAFGPFLVTATFLTIFFGDRLLDWYLRFLGL
ncbi:MAG: hypothetical protein XU08_C0002G0008 [candidate division WWE3 bacterium CSP1-7]|uniref:Uncharacterized protein n=1 Tax=candidate division WWE3 bacterium CSP1-7 TaxID=1576480 RepID=A0A0T5ZXR9_UNCKA|nr:MAG: hypothetical protein XU08_C0002G0008 [candidate division WWE3 bacterium CSP1-7]